MSPVLPKLEIAHCFLCILNEILQELVSPILWLFFVYNWIQWVLYFVRHFFCVRSFSKFTAFVVRHACLLRRDLQILYQNLCSTISAFFLLLYPFSSQNLINTPYLIILPRRTTFMANLGWTWPPGYNLQFFQSLPLEFALPRLPKILSEIGGLFTEYETSVVLVSICRPSPCGEWWDWLRKGSIVAGSNTSWLRWVRCRTPALYLSVAFIIEKCRWCSRDMASLFQYHMCAALITNTMSRRMYFAFRAIH